MFHKDKCTCTPLHEFCYRKIPAAVLQLLDNIKNIDEKDCFGRTPLMCVFLLYRKIEKDVKNLKDKLLILTETLLERGVNPNILDKNGDNILHIVAQATRVVKNEKVLKRPTQLLLDAGAENEFRNSQGMTPYDIAFRNHAAKIGIILQLFTPTKSSRMSSRNSSIASPSSLSNSVGSYDDVTSTEDDASSLSNESYTIDEINIPVSNNSNSNHNDDVSLKKEENNSVLMKNSNDDNAEDSDNLNCKDAIDGNNDNNEVNVDNSRAKDEQNNNELLINFEDSNEKETDVIDDQLPSFYKDIPVSTSEEGNWVMINGNSNQRSI